jgi:hypothetical protein
MSFFSKLDTVIITPFGSAVNNRKNLLRFMYDNSGDKWDDFKLIDFGISSNSIIIGIMTETE